MKTLYTSLLIASCLSNSIAQIGPSKQGSIGLSREVDLSTTPIENINPVFQKIEEAPKPASDMGLKKEYLHHARLKIEAENQTKSAQSAQDASQIKIEPSIQFAGNNPSSTPNDNSCAMSDSGHIISVVNSNMAIYNDTGKQLKFIALSSFASSVLGTFASISDPRVIYDPNEKKFIVTFFSGASSTTNQIIVAFSKTSNPMLAWNFYIFNGNPNKDTTWSDYPIISLSKSDFFITFNHVKDNTPWQQGFRYSAIWQFDKKRGFNGDSIKYNYWNNIKHQGKSIWSVCAVMQSGLLQSDDMQFLSVRPSDLNNDTVFLHNISNSYQSGLASFSTKVLKTNLSYGLSPNAIQADKQQLATNDARVLHAVKINQNIYYVQNCREPVNLRSGIYLGKLNLTNNSIKGQIISYDSMDLGYPSISLVGNYALDEKCIINASFVKKNGFAGVLALYKDKNDIVHAPLMLKYGLSSINVQTNPADTIERWGDYSGIQQIYGDLNSVILSHYYARNTNNHGTWIAKLTLVDSLNEFTSINKNISNAHQVVYNNPFENNLELMYTMTTGDIVDIALYDLQGKKVKTLLRDFYTPGKYKFSMNTEELKKGIYILEIASEKNGEAIRKKIVRE